MTCALYLQKIWTIIMLWNQITRSQEDDFSGNLRRCASVGASWLDILRQYISIKNFRLKINHQYHMKSLSHIRNCHRESEHFVIHNSTLLKSHEESCTSIVSTINTESKTAFIQCFLIVSAKRTSSDKGYRIY